MTMKIDPNSGFCSESKIYHSLRPTVALPPENSFLSISDYVFSLLQPSSSNYLPGINSTALIDSVSGDRISYSEFINQVQSLAFSLQSQLGLCKGDSAFIISPANTQIPILYFSLFSIGVIISPSNPTSSVSEISYQLDLCKPVIAFATSKTAHKLNPSLLRLLRYPVILLYSPEFDSMMKTKTSPIRGKHRDPVSQVAQSDTAAILYSSGTTGRVKGVMLSHRNLITFTAGIYAVKTEGAAAKVVLCTVPFFHIYGLVSILKAVVMGEALVLLTDQRFDMRRMLKAVEDFKVTNLAVAPPVVLAMTKGYSDNRVAGMSGGYDLSSLETVSCGGAPLAVDVIGRFKEQFPNVVLAQGYGLTETGGGFFRAIGPKESSRLGSTGRLAANHQVKIVDPETGAALPPSKPGELWVKGPTIMKGYVGNEDATSEALDMNGWLRTGDLCYIDNDGFLYVIDRLKELIKYKGYQVPPAELEELLQSHPDIVDAAVIPYPNEEAGQVPMAFVVRRPQSSLNELQVIDFIAKQVAPYKKIRKVAFIDSIPKNAPGKVLRKDLLKLALVSSNKHPTAAKL